MAIRCVGGYDASMLLQMFPQNRRITMGSKKGFASHYVPAQNYSEIEMYRYVQRNNLAAIKVLLIWLSFNAISGILYVFKIIGSKEPDSSVGVLLYVRPDMRGRVVPVPKFYHKEPLLCQLAGYLTGDTL